MSVRVLLIDNYDSFTFNLVDELRRRGAAVEVWRNDLAADEAMERILSGGTPRLLVLSPGPGRPGRRRVLRATRSTGRGRRAGVRVCLGLQVMVQALGGTVVPAGEVVHGKAVPITHEGTGLFTGLPSPMTVGRYHSLVAGDVPSELRVTARYGDFVMALEHEAAPLAGVQFHPESILTRQGGELMGPGAGMGPRRGLIRLGAGVGAPAGTGLSAPPRAGRRTTPLPPGRHVLATDLKHRPRGP